MSENNIQQAAKAYRKLIDHEYNLTLGRKGKLTNVTLHFSKGNFYHLTGLHYLKDRPNLNRKRSVVFDEIENGIIKASSVETSAFYDSISDRIGLVTKLEKTLDSDFQFYTFDLRRNRFSNIKADYVIRARDERGQIFLFLALREESVVECCSMFYNEQDDYIRNQSHMTVLSVEKRSVENHNEH